MILSLKTIYHYKHLVRNKESKSILQNVGLHKSHQIDLDVICWGLEPQCAVKVLNQGKVQETEINCFLIWNVMDHIGIQKKKIKINTYKYSKACWSCKNSCNKGAERGLQPGWCSLLKRMCHFIGRPKTVQDIQK